MSRLLNFLILITGATTLLISQIAGASVKYETTSDWGTGFNGQIRILNDTDQPIENWVLEFEWDRSLNQIWDARITRQQDGRYRIVPESWNARIAPGASVRFGFGGAPGNLREGPKNVVLTHDAVQKPAPSPPTAPQPEPSQPSSGAVRVRLQQSSVWAGGYSGAILITNNGSKPVQPWTLEFEAELNVQSLWNGVITKSGNRITLRGDGTTAGIDAGGTVNLGFTAEGRFPAAAHNCRFNGQTCELSVSGEMQLPAPGAPGGPAAPAIRIEPADIPETAGQLTVGQSEKTFQLQTSGPGGNEFTVTLSNPSLARVSIDGTTLTIQGLKPGRAGLRIEEKKSGAVRFTGLRVLTPDGKVPELPEYLALGSVSEDTAEHLSFWESFAPGPRNKRVDIRYIYLNGGPVQGWHTWGATPGSRLVNYIRNSRRLGIIPFFVWYNIPEGAESYEVVTRHVKDEAYLTAYFKNLKFALELVNRESPDDTVGFVLEPDFLGYLAQNEGRPAAEIPAATHTIYTSGLLKRGEDPAFPDSVKGFVSAVNYLIRKVSPQVYFGWQMNLWASPAGGWTVKIPTRGVIQLTRDMGIEQGRAAIRREAQAITRYYLEAGVASHGARFLSIDKYGLDAVGFEPGAAANPAGSIWFWNADLWGNYLVFVRAMHDESNLPVILWQLPVGRINSTLAKNPYAGSGKFPELANTHQRYEDSAPTYFFGDTFRPGSETRLRYFSTNEARDPSINVNGEAVTWGQHMNAAARAGVVAALFGAGVGMSTSSVGSPPTEDYWWITRAQEYFEKPVILSPDRSQRGSNSWNRRPSR